MDGENIIVLALVGVAAYFLYESYIAAPSLSTSTAVAPPSQWTAEGGTAAQWTALSAAQQQSWILGALSTAVANSPVASAAAGSSSVTPVAAIAATAAPGVTTPNSAWVALANQTGANETAPPSSLADLANGIQVLAAQGQPDGWNGTMLPWQWAFYANQILNAPLPGANNAAFGLPAPAYVVGATPVTFAAWWAGGGEAAAAAAPPGIAA